jgi:hypothetical protein
VNDADYPHSTRAAAERIVGAAFFVSKSESATPTTAAEKGEWRLDLAGR